MSVDVIDDEFFVCSDCIMMIANGDSSQLDLYYKPDEADRRREDIFAGLRRMADGGGYICVGDSERDIEFSTRDCDCCGSNLHGSRCHCVVLAG